VLLAANTSLDTSAETRDQTRACDAGIGVAFRTLTCRFESRVGKQSARKLVKLWAEKEMANLTPVTHIFFVHVELVSAQYVCHTLLI
jgi:serine/threonine-protein kinase RIO1